MVFCFANNHAAFNLLKKKGLKNLPTVEPETERLIISVENNHCYCSIGKCIEGNLVHAEFYSIL